MSSKTTTTVRLDPEDLAALERARADGHSGSELIRRGLRLVAAQYYGARRAPTTKLFVSTDAKLGDESELLRLMGVDEDT
jgi:Arc/MetJ-type ribon-helix-helix transcriptional regulator